MSDDIDLIREFVRREAAIVFDSNLRDMVEARMVPVLAKFSLNNLRDLVAQLAWNMDLRSAVIESLTTNETSFFRDPLFFRSLVDRFLPDLLDNRSKSKVLRIWCAASSTGQEVYSLLILLHDRFPSVLNWDLQFFASDISESALQRAKSALYTQFEVNRGLPAASLLRHFSKEGDDWRVNEYLRSIPRFFKLNLVDNWPAFPTFDIVLIRNVMIYFEPSVKMRILAKIHSILAPDGILALGGSENTVGLSDSFRRSPHSPNYFYLPN